MRPSFLKFGFIAVALISLFSFTTSEDKRKIEIIVQPGNCEVEEMNIYSFMGLEFELVLTEKIDKSGNFIINLPKGKRHFLKRVIHPFEDPSPKCFLYRCLE